MSLSLPLRRVPTGKFPALAHYRSSSRTSDIVLYEKSMTLLFADLMTVVHRNHYRYFS